MPASETLKASPPAVGAKAIWSVFSTESIPSGGICYDTFSLSVCIWIWLVKYFQRFVPQRFLEISGMMFWKAWENFDKLSHIIWFSMCFHSERAERWYWSENNIFNYNTALSGRWAGFGGLDAALRSVAHTHKRMRRASGCSRASWVNKTHLNFSIYESSSSLTWT